MRQEKIKSSNTTSEQLQQQQPLASQQGPLFTAANTATPFIARPFVYWLNKHRYYHRLIARFYQFMIPAGSKVLQLNCKNGYLLNAVKPSLGVGVDQDAQLIEQAQATYPHHQFYVGSLADLPAGQTYDYIILSCALMEEYDIQDLCTALRSVCHSRTRLIIDFYAYLWEPFLQLAQKIGVRRPTNIKHWVSVHDVKTFLELADFQVVSQGRSVLMPVYIPLIAAFCNRILIHIPLINRLSLHTWLVVRPLGLSDNKAVTVSVIIPCRNERGNVEPAVLRTPIMGAHTELIFVEGHSKDDTLAEMARVAQAYPDRAITYFAQDGKGKGDAVRKGFAHATGDVLMILDGDLTMPPEELPKFYSALVANKGELINGSRLVYGMENGAMRFLNLLANFFFSVLFSWLLGQKVKDTLCGTKVLWRRDYEMIAAHRAYFGDFDPFGDFDILFGGAKLQLKIIDMPIHYKSRTYGSTQIRRFYHGWILLWMSWVGVMKFKVGR